MAIAEYGRRKKEWLSKFLDLSAGIPSHDRFNAVFAALKPGEFEKCLLNWITALHEISDGQIVAIDGKTRVAHRYRKLRSKRRFNPTCRMKVDVPNEDSTGKVRHVPVVD